MHTTPRSAARRYRCHSLVVFLLHCTLNSSESSANAFCLSCETSASSLQHNLRGATHALRLKSDYDPCEEYDECILSDRRHILRSGGASAAALLTLSGTSTCTLGGNTPPAALADTTTIPTPTTPQSNLLMLPNLRCLTDLPPVTPGCVRLYLCRHGQTENNRLRMVQGARVDPSLNVYGREMAARIGMALSYLPEDVMPKVAVHSQLTRARETAQIAAKTLSDVRLSSRKVGRKPEPAALIDTYGVEATSIAVPTGSELSRTGIRFETLPCIGEVDFGTGYDGMSVEAVRAGMYATYGSWAVGMIDRRMDGEGESGREVLARAAEALQSLAGIAKNNDGTVLAVSHSTYLRTLLGGVMDVPLAQAATAEQRNGCINVLDVDVEGLTTTLGPKSGIFGGSLSIVKDFNLALPQTKVIRMNEYRHLEGITWPAALN